MDSWAEKLDEEVSSHQKPEPCGWVLGSEQDHRTGLESKLDLRLKVGMSLMGVEVLPSPRTRPPPPIPCTPVRPCRRPSGIPEKDLCSAMAPYLLQQRDALRRCVQKQEAENRQLADAVLAGRRQVEEVQLQVQARQQAWQVSALRHMGPSCSRGENRPREGK